MRRRRRGGRTRNRGAWRGREAGGRGRKGFGILSGTACGGENRGGRGRGRGIEGGGGSGGGRVGVFVKVVVDVVVEEEGGVLDGLKGTGGRGGDSFVRGKGG